MDAVACETRGNSFKETDMIRSTLLATAVVMIHALPSAAQHITDSVTQVNTLVLSDAPAMSTGNLYLIESQQLGPQAAQTVSTPQLPTSTPQPVPARVSQSRKPSVHMSLAPAVNEGILYQDVSSAQ